MTKRRLDDLERRVQQLEQRLPGVILPGHLREARMRAGWSQVELARRIGVRQSTIVRWEAGAHLCSGAQADRVVAVFDEAGIAAPVVG